MNIVVELEDGVVQRIVSDEKANVVIVDRYTEGCDDEDICKVLGEEAYVYEGIRETTVNRDIVHQVLKDINQN